MEADGEALERPLRIAVIGAGIAGITAAYLLARRHDVTLIERNGYVGGHTNTIAVPESPDRAVPVDTGFIVCNARTYPFFYRLLDEWGVRLRDSEMSFGYFCERTGLGYVGPSLREFLRRASNFLDRRFLGIAFEQRRFNRRALRDLESGGLDDIDLGAYLEQVGARPGFVEHYLLPLASAVWSSPQAEMLRFPAATFIRFFSNHGMLDLRRRPTWQTVVGGSQAYVRAFLSKFPGRVLVDTPVTGVRREADGVAVRLRDGPGGETLAFDRVVLATHADESLSLLEDADEEERDLLSAWSYHRNSVLLHTDTSVLPRDRRLWASWNVYRPTDAGDGAPVRITYSMNRLQGIVSDREYLVSLNQDGVIDPESVLYSIDYTHPAYTPPSIRAQGTLRKRNGLRRTYLCGSYMRYGFHEDAVVSAIGVAEKLGVFL